MLFRVVELITAWYEGHITDDEFLIMLRLTLRRADLSARQARRA